MGHIHAAAMAEYAKDAAETDMPWERWEFSYGGKKVGAFFSLAEHPNWDADREYRRKAKTLLINGHEVPEPHRTPLEIGDAYWTFTFFFAGVIEVYWDGDSEDHNAFNNGLIHLTKEAAEKHFEALKSFTAKGDQ